VQTAALGPSFIQIGSSKKKFYQILSNSKPRKFSEFLSEIDFDSRDVPMEKVVPFPKPFPTMFYFKFFELGKVFFIW
jgi:hypothetical protein